MQDHHLNQLRKALSDERLSSYSSGDKDFEKTVANYVWNIALCEALYPALNCLEISIRNHLHQLFTLRCNTDQWFRKLDLTEIQTSQLNEAIRQLSFNGKPTHEAGRIVAELSFKFWTSFFNKSYEQFWLESNYIETTFENVPRRYRNRKKIKTRLEEIRILRNRVYHYEPLWKKEHLELIHQDLIYTVGWFPPAMKLMLKTLDRFEEVYRLRSKHYQAKLNENL